MSWSAPRTWVDGEVPTDTILNAHIRDNYLLLKTPFDDEGRITALDSDTVDDLDGTSLTGIGLLSGSVYSAKNTFKNAWLVLPVGVHPTNPGEPTIVGDYFHHMDAGSTEWRYLGILIGACPGRPGSIWVEGTSIHYVDEDGDERYLPSETTGLHADVAAREGSAWIETFFHFIEQGGTQERMCHSDVHGDAHSDVAAHSDHSDDYSDDPGHSDHLDSYTDTHTDTVDYTDGYDDHADHGDNTPGYSDHSDHQDDWSHSDGYTDAYADAPEEV